MPEDLVNAKKTRIQIYVLEHCWLLIVDIKSWKIKIEFIEINLDQMNNRLSSFVYLESCHHAFSMNRFRTINVKATFQLICFFLKKLVHLLYTHTPLQIHDNTFSKCRETNQLMKLIINWLVCFFFISLFSIFVILFIPRQSHTHSLTHMHLHTGSNAHLFLSSRLHNLSCSLSFLLVNLSD